MMRLGFRWVLIPFLLLCFRGVCFCNQAPHGTPATPVAGPAAEKFSNALDHAQQQWLKNHPVIRIGFAPERPPFEFIDGQGQQSGLVADYLDLIAKRLNVRFKRVDKDDGSLLSWAEIQEAGRKKELDVIVGLIQTETRDVYLNFTRPYLEFPWALIVNDSSDTPREITDFLGQPVAVIASYPVRGQLSRLYPGLVFIPVDTPLQGLIAVARGRAAVFVTNAAEAAYFIKNASLSQLKIVGVVPEMDARLRMGVRKDWPVLTEILDKAIASLTPRETTEIHNRWISLDFNSGVDWEKMLTVAVPAVLVVLIFIVVGVIVNRRLQSEVVKRRQTEEDLRFALETADAYYFQFDLKKDTVTYSSINTFLRHGYSEENIPRTNEAFSAFVHPDDVALKDEKNKEYMEKKLPSIQFPFRFRKPDYNGWFWINTTYRCTEWDENGEPVKFVGLHQDITERQTLLEQVKSSSEQLNFAMEAAGAYSWQVDYQTRSIAYTSLYVFTVAGYSEEEAPTTPETFYSLIHPDDVDSIQGLFEDIFQGRRSSAKVDYRFRQKHAGWMWLHSAGRAAQWDASGQVTKITGLTMDITERYTLNEKIKRSQEQLRFTLDAVGAFSWQIDRRDNTFSYDSLRFFENLGYQEEEIPKTLDAHLPNIHPDDRQQVLDSFEKHYQGELPVINVDYRVWKKEGEPWIWLNTFGHTVEWDDQGKSLTVTGLTQNITERQALFEQIKTSHEKFIFALDTANAFYWEMDLKTDILTHSSSQCFIRHGYTEDQIPKTGTMAQTILHPDDFKVTEKRFEEYVQGKAPSVQSVYRYKSYSDSDSDWFWVSSVWKIIERDEQGQPLKLAGLNQDVTESQKLHLAIQASQEQLRIISEHTYDWQSWLDLDGRLLWINQGVERITGYSVEECMVMKDYPRHLIDDRDWDLFLGATEKAVSEQKRHECILRIRCKDGDRIWVSAAYEPVLDKNGQVTGLAGAAKDITKQKEAERGLHLMSRVFEDGADPIIITDLSGIILDLNEAVSTAYGYSRDELIGKEIGTLVSKEADIRGKALFQRCINGEILKNIEGERIRKDGTRIPQLFTFSLLKNDEGKPLGIASIAKDITELKQAEKELKDYRDHLEELVKKRTADLEEAKLVAEEATKAKSDFLANMSHEIRTPLNAIIGFSHLARQTELDVIQSDYIRKIETGSKALLGVINDILDFSKIEAGKLSMEDIEFSLEDVLETVTNLVGIRAQEKGLEVIYNIDPALPLKLIGDPVRMGQILLNLTNNAVKFTETGEIVIGCSLLASDSDEVQLKFYVQDSGIGLTREQQNKLFQAFAQADSSTTRKYGGTGLGLFISKFLVEMMKGRIWVESVYGQGTTFFFTVRLKCAGLSTITSDLHDTDIQHKKVLVVDDNYISRTVLEKMLEAMSFTVIQAESAEAGFAELEAAEKSNEPFALVLMDWKMPGMDGLHAAAQIKSSMKENIPSIIMVSAYAREELMREANRMGLSGYLIKPVSPSLLSDSIMSALGGKNLSRPSGWQAGEGLPSVAAIRGAKLLVAEDNEVNQQVARGILENNGFIVDIADNGLLAVEALEYAVYDAVLMDINMPEMDGYTAARQIRKDPKFNDLPIIAMTANAMTGDREKALDAGMNDHVAKPIDVKDLLSVLSKWVRPVGKALHPSVDLAQVPSPQVNKETETAVGGFGPLPGIDVADGLARLGGDSRLYRDLLNKFAQNHADTADRILSALSVADMETAQRLAHTIKGVAGNIGAKPLFNVVTQIDTALKEADIDTAHSLLGAFEVCLTQTIEGINAMAQQTRSDPAVQVLQPHAPDFTPEAIRPILITLSKMLEDNDTDAGTIVRQLKAVIQEDVPRNLVAQLAGKISGYDFDGAAQLLQALCRELGIKLE